MKKHIDDLTNKELDRLCALAQGWTKQKDTNPAPDIFGDRWFWVSQEDGEGEYIGQYAPTSQTEQGMAQCFQLMVKFAIEYMPSLARGSTLDDGACYKPIDSTCRIIQRDKNPQIAICKAVCFQHYGEEVEV